MRSHLFLIWKNLRRNTRRSILTVLSISISVFLIGALTSVYGMFYREDVSEEAAMRLVTRHKVSLTQALPYFYGEKIRGVDGVENLVPMNWFGGKFRDYKPENMFPRFAVDPMQIFDIYSEYKLPAEQLQAFQRDRQAIAIGKPVAERTGLSLGDRITIQGDIYPVDLEFTVRAIFGVGPDHPSQDDFNSFFHYKYLEESFTQGEGSSVGVFAIRLRSADDAILVAEAVDEMFRNAPQPTKTETERAFQLAFVSQVGNIKLFLLSIAGAIMFTMLLVSANTIAMSVRERTREIGVLKTLGFPSGSVMTLVLGEAVALSGLGGAIGVGLTIGLTAMLANQFVGLFSGFEMPSWGILACFSVALVVGLGSSAVPAAIAARTRVVEALRHTG